MNRLGAIILLSVPLILSAAFPVLPASLRPTVAQSGTTQTSVATSLQVDLGTVPNATFPLDNSVTHVFTVKNTGTQNLTIAVAAYNSQSQGVPSYPQPGVFTVQPNQQRKVSLVIDEGSGYFPEITPPAGGQLAAGDYDVQVKWVIQNQYNLSDSKTFTVSYPVRVIDPTKTYCEMHVDGRVTDSSGSPVAGLFLTLFSQGTANYMNSTAADGSFAFCVPKYSGWVLSTASTAGGQAYQPTYTFVSPRVTSYDVVVTPASKVAEGSFALIRQVSTQIGFWMGQPSADGSLVLLTQGMEIWPPGGDRSAADLLLYRTDGQLVWNYSMGWESWAASLSPDGKYATYVTLNGTSPRLGLLNATTGQPIWVQTLDNSTFPVNPQTLTTTHTCRAIQISGDDRYIGLGCSEGMFYLLSASTGQVLWYRYLVGQVRNVKFSSDDRYVYVGTDPYLFKYDVVTQALVWKADIAAWPLSDGLALSSDGSIIASMSKNGFVTVVSTADGSVLWSADTGGIGQFVAVSPDGSRVAGDSFGGFWVYDAKSGTPLWRTTASKDGRFSSDGSLVVGPSSSILSANGADVQTLVVPGATTPSWYQFVYMTPDMTHIVATVACCGGYQSTGVYFYSGSVSYTQVTATSTTATFATSTGTATGVPPSGRPNVTVSPASGPSGTTVTISGSGLPQSHEFRYCYLPGTPPQPPTPPSQCPSDAPTFTTTADGGVPSSPPVTLQVTGQSGPYTVTVSDSSSPFVLPLNFMVTGPATTTGTTSGPGTSTASQPGPASTSSQSAASSESSPTTSTGGGGGILEFPYQPVAATVLAVAVVALYLVSRNRPERI